MKHNGDKGKLFFHAMSPLIKKVSLSPPPGECSESCDLNSKCSVSPLHSHHIGGMEHFFTTSPLVHQKIPLSVHPPSSFYSLREPPAFSGRLAFYWGSLTFYLKIAKYLYKNVMRGKVLATILYYTIYNIILYNLYYTILYYTIILHTKQRYQHG